MHFAGLALFLYTATVIGPQTQQATLTAPPAVGAPTQSVTSPDPAPPHPLTPRVMPPPDGPAAAALRVALELAKAALRSHGH